MQDKDTIIKQLAEENKQLPEHIKLLEERIARLEKNSSNSSKPPSSDIINPQPANKKKKKRKIGGQIGHPKYNRDLFEAEEIDRTVIPKISVEEVRRRGLIMLDKTESVLQQIDLPAKLLLWVPMKQAIKIQHTNQHGHGVSKHLKPCSFISVTQEHRKCCSIFSAEITAES